MHIKWILFDLSLLMAIVGTVLYHREVKHAFVLFFWTYPQWMWQNRSYEEDVQFLSQTDYWFNLGMCTMAGWASVPFVAFAINRLYPVSRN